MDAVRYPVVELRQYTLRPGQRDVLVELFDREFVESQEAAGMAVIGQFRDLDDPDRFVWLRGFASMPARAAALARFYGGPAWTAHAARANATMIDSDNVLLLRPVTARAWLPGCRAAPGRVRPAGPVVHSGHALLRCGPVRPGTRGLLRPRDPAGAHRDGRRAAGLAADRARREHLPRAAGPAGENVFAWLARFPGPDHLAAHLGRLGNSAAWQDRVLPALAPMITGAPERLRLAPTARSLLR